MSEYSAKIVKASDEMNAIARVSVKNTMDGFSLKTVMKDVDEFVINVKRWALVDYHNERAENPDYQRLVIIDDAGKKYYTGSSTFISMFADIVVELAEDGICEFNLKVIKLDSKNYAGEKFLSCNVVL